MGIVDLNLFEGVFLGKKVLITGDTGFKGSWLAIWLKELGSEVYGYALPPKTERDNFVKSNLHDVIKHIDGDVRDRAKLDKFIHDVRPDFVFHLAAQSLVLESYRDPQNTFETNIIGTVNVFEAVRKTDSVSVVINVTSDKCYQNNNWVWGYRETDPLGGSDPYSASKGCAELVTTSYTKSFFDTSPCRIASVRAGNVIGGGDWAINRIVPDFFRSVRSHQPLLIRNPRSTRPWQFVLEPLSGYLMLCAKLFLRGREYAGAWNFGPAESHQHTVVDLIEEIIKVFGKGEYKIEETGDNPLESNLLRLDISKAANILNWFPVLEFSSMSKLTVEGYQLDLSPERAYSSRVQQIDHYIKKAQEKELEWVSRLRTPDGSYPAH